MAQLAVMSVAGDESGGPFGDEGAGPVPGGVVLFETASNERDTGERLPGAAGHARGHDDDQQQVDHCADAHQREPSSPRLQADARGAMAQGVDERQPQRDRDDEWDQQNPGVAGHPPVGQARREEPREGDWIGQRFHSGEPGL